MVSSEPGGGEPPLKIGPNEFEQASEQKTCFALVLLSFCVFSPFMLMDVT